ncbi:MAG: NADP-dependent malic enzyme [Clostridia bacterium]|nr:NADP-dependent malic enzyme [Clostridia bacterium]
MGIREQSLEKHYEWGGKIEVVTRCEIETREDLSLAYTPGVAEPCLAIEADKDKSYLLTRRSNLVAVITDGTAVLGLGDIGPLAGMPVMEGKCALFKSFADVDAFPICVNSKDVDEIVKTIYNISGSFGGINLEDISAPRCFEIERRLCEICDIPVFHDDQHGTAIVVAAALINALRVVKKEIGEIRCVINGAGSAGTAIAEHLMALGVKHIIMVDRFGALSRDDETLSPAHKELAMKTNEEMKKGSLGEVIEGADVFIGVSVKDALKPEMVGRMAKDAIVFAMANPSPEIMPDVALRAGARIVGTGRSDFPNQINNVLAFPGIFRGALDCRASAINKQMQVATSYALANLIKEEELSEENIIPNPLDKSVVPTVAAAVIEAARKSGVARI